MSVRAESVLILVESVLELVVGVFFWFPQLKNIIVSALARMTILFFIVSHFNLLIRSADNPSKYNAKLNCALNRECDATYTTKTVSLVDYLPRNKQNKASL